MNNLSVEDWSAWIFGINYAKSRLTGWMNFACDFQTINDNRKRMWNSVEYISISEIEIEISIQIGDIWKYLGSITTVDPSCQFIARTIFIFLNKFISRTEVKILSSRSAISPPRNKIFHARDKNNPAFVATSLRSFSTQSHSFYPPEGKRNKRKFSKRTRSRR